MSAHVDFISNPLLLIIKAAHEEVDQMQICGHCKAQKCIRNDDVEIVSLFKKNPNQTKQKQNKKHVNLIVKIIKKKNISKNIFKNTIVLLLCV